MAARRWIEKAYGAFQEQHPELRYETHPTIENTIRCFDDQKSRSYLLRFFDAPVSRGGKITMPTALFEQEPRISPELAARMSGFLGHHVEVNLEEFTFHEPTHARSSFAQRHGIQLIPFLASLHEILQNHAPKQDD